MDKYKLKFTKLQNEIFRLMCIKSGNALNKREIANLLDVSPTAIAKALVALEKENLVKVEKIKGMNLTHIELNRDNQNALLMKRTENLKQIYESGFAEFLEENFPGTTIILFGSYSRGDDTITSDIDMAVIEAKAKKINIDVFEKILEREIRINYYDSFRGINKELKENICNGIVLAGGIRL